MKSDIDILGLGCTAVDELIYVAAYPPVDAKTRVLRRERHCGGLTATALVAGARLGAKCAYAGVLGADEQSQFVLDCLEREGIEVSRTCRREGARPIRSVIVVDERRKTRNIFFDVQRVVGAGPQWPPEQLVRSARALLVDIYGVPGMIRAARIARAACIPVVGDFERSDVAQFHTLFRLVDHLIIPDGFACQMAKTADAATAAEKLWRSATRWRFRPAVVIVTCGGNGCFSVDQHSDRAEHWPAFRVKAVDTTGCGDVFHGAYAAGLAAGLDLAERIRIASAAAALKATRPGGQAGIPTRAVVERFLKQR